MSFLRKLFDKTDGSGCAMCRRPTHSYDQILSKQSLAVQAGSAARAHTMAEAQGYRCKGCGAIYCKACLERKAPSNHRGGRACPRCGGDFDYVRD